MMNEEEQFVIYSPEILTKDGLFELSSDGAHVIAKHGDSLVVVDPISLSIAEQLGTYPEAENAKISPDSNHVCFLENGLARSIRVIELNSKETFCIEINNNFLIERLFWSPDSRFIIFTSELGVHLWIHEIGGKTIILEGPSQNDFNAPLVCFSPKSDYFSLLKFGYLITYSTETWHPHSKIKCLLNPVGIIYTGCYTIGVWNSAGSFVVYSLLGDHLYERKSTITSRIKAAKLCMEKRILALATYDDKIELYDVISWEQLYCFDYPVKLKGDTFLIWTEPTSPLQFNDKSYFDQLFQQTSSILLKPLKNICDEFKTKIKHKYLVAFSSGNNFIASYSPGLKNIVWIRSLKTGKLSGVIVLSDETSVQGFKWHPDKEILAITTLDSVIFWSEIKTFAVYCKTLLSYFNWLKTKLTICCIATSNGGVFIYLENGK